MQVRDSGTVLLHIARQILSSLNVDFGSSKLRSESHETAAFRESCVQKACRQNVTLENAARWCTFKAFSLAAGEMDLEICVWMHMGLAL